MIAKFKTTPDRIINHELQERRMQDFQEYLSGKYDYISKFQMLVDEKEMRINHNLSLAEAISVWKRLYQD